MSIQLLDITFRFRGPDLLCRLVKFLQVFVLYLSTYVLTSMSIDRYLVVCHHNFSRNYYGSLRGPKVLVILSYIISFVLASPQAFLFSMKEIEVSFFYIASHQVFLLFVLFYVHTYTTHSATFVSCHD